MGYPRSLLIDPSGPGVYHCVSRCVRRAFLCRQDAVSGRNFDHRKQWIEDRLLTLADIFSASVLAYAVMSNHVHIVARMDPASALRWSDSTVAERWATLFPVHGPEPDIQDRTGRIAALLANPERLAVVRERLGNLSWFMRCLSEPIARRANRKDDCSGRFWEGRFKCQVLLDDRAVLACMTYVDLNPVRAGLADGLANSAHTSIRRRIRGGIARDLPMNAVAGADASGLFALRNEEYVALVDATGRRLHATKRGVIAEPTTRSVQQMVDDRSWVTQVQTTETRCWRAIGSFAAMADRARALGQRWLKGGGRRTVTA